MKRSTPPSYDKIFAIKIGSVSTIAQNTTLPPNRALLVINSSATGSALFTFTNTDGTSVNLFIPTGSTLLPLEIKSYSFTESPTTVYIYGLS